ncbi:MAG: glycosyltransferase family 39 protein [Anaerolineae bacterium]|nr:glycosyltransferase family 39 protein [Anaerolineae bacterium]
MKTSSKFFTTLLWLTCLTLLGAALRFYQLGASPLRGDEAFAVRYWAAPLTDIFDASQGLAWKEPHPYGTFLLFGAWKGLAGSSEVAMRMLPLLVNLLGVPTMYALGKRLFHDPQIGMAGAALWAINPNLIWHSQDVRNYAIWAALSLINMWLLVRISDPAIHPRRRDWLLYIAMVTVTLYVFFLEAFMLVVHGLYVMIARRERLRAWIAAAAIIGVLLIPWGYQLVRLSQAGYRATGASADVGMLFTVFVNQLLYGETTITTSLTSVVLMAVGLMLLALYRGRGITLLMLWVIVPAALLLLVATRMNVFWPRYLIASTPALLFPIATLMVMVWRSVRAINVPLIPNLDNRLILVMGAIPLFTVAYSTAAAWAVYVGPNYHKAPDWFSLRDYLHTNVTSADTVIMTSLDPNTGNADPSFEWYYRDAAPVITLPNPNFDMATAIQTALSNSRAVWYVVSGDDPRLNVLLLEHGSLITDTGAGRSFLVRQYRGNTVKPEEVTQPRHYTIGGGKLLGYSVAATPTAGGTLTLLLFWDVAPDPALTTFVHLIGTPKPDGSPLWAQKDHPPQAPGRDLYLLDLANVPAGHYQLEIGLYDAMTKTRATIVDEEKRVLGDSTVLMEIDLP